MLRSTLLLLVSPLVAVAADKFEFKDGDKVVLIGSTLIEREQRYGYWEAALTARNPDKNITFRNLGWSGDTVWGEARAGFGTPADGYKQLIEHVKAEKPTVIIVGYGTNESFAGPEGLPKFKEQLKKLLDDLAVTNARFVLMPPGHKINRNMQLYKDAIRELAAQRGLCFADPDASYNNHSRPILSNEPSRIEGGMHYNALGYYQLTPYLLEALGYPPALHRIRKSGRGPHKGEFSSLPFPRMSNQLNRSQEYRFSEVGPGALQLKIDGNKIGGSDVHRFTENDVGIALVEGPDFDQAEQLRQTIIAKNELYFHRWRPQNMTYLFGFRKHEQGNNAVEIPKFDPLIEAKEKEIAKLRIPREHVYELVPVKEEKK